VRNRSTEVNHTTHDTFSSEADICLTDFHVSDDGWLVMTPKCAVAEIGTKSFEGAVGGHPALAVKLSNFRSLIKEAICQGG
jgi:hypothetical protein